MLWDCPRTAVEATANVVDSADNSISTFLANPQSWEAEEAFWTAVANDLLLSVQSAGASGLNGQAVTPVQISNSTTCPANGYYTAGQWAGLFLFGLAGGAEFAAEDAAAESVLPTPIVSNPKLQNIVNDLYKGTTNPNRVGTGTTADAVRSEIETGQPTGGLFHSQKAQDYSNGLRKLINGGTLDAYDRLVAQSLFDDLQAALRHRP
jgi:hypothetical protein